MDSFPGNCPIAALSPSGRGQGEGHLPPTNKKDFGYF